MRKEAGGGEIYDPKVEVARSFISLMTEVHADSVNTLTRHQKSRLGLILMAVKDVEPQVSEQVLERIIKNNPLAKANFCLSRFPGGVDMHTVALQWENPLYAELRDIAETECGMTEIEARFLSLGVLSQPDESGPQYVDPNYPDI
jgi:hypothetical protein